MIAHVVLPCLNGDSQKAPAVIPGVPIGPGSASVAAATDLLGRLRKFRLDPLYDHVDESRQAMVKECIQASQAWAIQLRAWVQSIESSIPKLVA